MLVVDDDVRSVAEFMEATMPASRLASVAKGLAALAPLLWGHFCAEEVRAIALVSAPISADGLPTQQVSNAHHLAQ